MTLRLGIFGRCFWQPLLLLVLLPPVLGMQAAAEQDLAKLIPRLSSDDPRMREEAAARIKAAGPAAIPILTRSCNSSDSELANRAQELLRWIQIDGALSPALKVESPGIVDKLSVSDPAEWARILLGLYSRVISSGVRPTSITLEDLRPLVKRALQGANTLDAQLTLCTVARFSRATEAVDALSEYLLDQEGSVRAAAADALGILGTPKQIAQLAPLLRDPNANVRYSAAHAIGAIGSESAVGYLAQALGDPDSSVRRTAVESLTSLGRSDHFTAIIRSLADPDALLKAAAIRAVVKLYKPSHEKALIQALQADEPVLRQSSILALTYSGAGVGHSQEIVALLSDPNPDVRRAAAFAAGQLDLVGAEAELGKMLAEKKASPRQTALEALADLGAVNSVELIRPLLKNRDAVLRERALWVLGELRAASFSDAMTEALTDDSYVVRRAAIDALGKVRAVPAAKAIARFLQDSSLEGGLSGVAGAAATALGRMEFREAAPELRRLLEHQPGVARIQSARALAAMGFRDGLAFLLASAKVEPTVKLLELNAIRSPSQWRSLRENKLRSDLFGTRRELLRDVCRELLKSDLEPAPHDELGTDKVRIHSLQQSLSLLDALESIIPTGWQLILGGETAHVVRTNEAVAFWESWAAGSSQDRK